MADVKLAPPFSYYTEDGGAHYHNQKHGVSTPVFNLVAASRAAKFQRFVLPEDVVLEYGVGTGWNLTGLVCARRLGFDVAESVVKYLPSNIEFSSDLDALGEHSLNVVICHHVLEHVPDPLSVLSQIRRLLKPGGRLILTVPLELERRYRRYNPHDNNHHVFSWNVQTLTNLVVQGGFSVQAADLQRTGYDRRAALITSRAGRGFGTYKLVRGAMCLIGRHLEIRIVASPAN